MRFFIPLVIFCTVLFSCKKENNPEPEPILKADTLSTGWSKVIVPGIDDFYDVYFLNNSTGYILGNSGLYKTTNGGVAWNNILPRNVAENLAVTPDGKVFFVTGQDSIYRSINGGASFSGIKLNNSRCTDVYFAGNDVGYIVASNQLYQTVNGGDSWTLVNPITGFNPGSQYYVSFFINSSTGWVTDGSRVFRMDGSVNNWKLASFNVPIQPGSTTIYAVSPDIIYLGSRTGIYKSVNGGADFSRLAGSPSNLDGYIDVHFTDTNTGYICAGKYIYKTADGGVTWEAAVKLGEGMIVEIHFTDAQHGWACGSDGLVLLFNL